MLAKEKRHTTGRMARLDVDKLDAFESVKITDIIVSERHHKHLSDLDGLAKKINKLGRPLQPSVALVEMHS
jgi:hypothetical protein